MIDPQRLADAIDDAECSGTMEAVGALLFATHPERAARLVDMPFGEQGKPQHHMRARADVLMMIQEMGIDDARLQRHVIATLYCGGQITAQVDRIVTGDGLAGNIRSGALEIKKLICANPRRRTARVAVLRATIESKTFD